MFNILTFGELLYDVYNDVSVIGGAPFNYSIQLSRLLNNDDTLPKGEGGKGENGISPFQKKGDIEMAKNVEELKQTLNAFVSAFQKFLDEEKTEDAHASDSEYKEAMDKAGCDSESEAEQKAFAEGVKYGEELMRNPDERKKLDSEHESEGEKKALGEDEDNYKEAMDKAGCDSESEAEQKAFAEGVKYAENLETKKTDDKEMEKKAEAASDKMISKAAFDEALKQAEIRGAAIATKHIKELYDAASKVKRTVSVNPLAYDSAADIYKAALRKEGADITGVDKSAYVVSNMATSKLASRLQRKAWPAEAY